MKIIPFKIPKPSNDAIIFQIDHEYCFFNKLHQHQEIQISYIVDGFGTAIVGNSINDFKKGDVIVIGSNLPHVFRNKKLNKKSLMYSLFFTKESLGDKFFELNEFKSFTPFFEQSNLGFKVTKNRKSIESYFLKLNRTTKLNRFIILLKILETLSTVEHKSLSTFISGKKFSDVEGKRMRSVIEYTMDNYRRPISLQEISAIANMSKNAFCKYFKTRTNKTYTEFLTELRIEIACEKLVFSNELSIAEIAEVSGFNNISYFNRKFRQLKAITPMKYRAKGSFVSY